MRQCARCALLPCRLSLSAYPYLLLCATAYKGMVQAAAPWPPALLIPASDSSWWWWGRDDHNPWRRQSLRAGDQEIRIRGRGGGRPNGGLFHGSKVTRGGVGDEKRCQGRALTKSGANEMGISHGESEGVSTGDMRWGRAAWQMCRALQTVAALAAQRSRLAPR